MSSWDDYKYEAFEGSNKLEPGDYRVVIVSAEERKSKSGNSMIVVGVKPSGSSITINSYFVKGEYFNRNISRFFDAFPEIEPGDFNFLGWIGCEGAARLKEDGDYMRIHFFLTPEQAEHLPAFEGKKPERLEVSELEEVEDTDLPF